MIGVRLSQNVDERLSRLSKKTNRTKSFYIKEALDLYLKMYEDDLLRISEYEEERKKGTLVTYSLEEIEKKHR